jgi:hypothetical protein
LPDLGVVESASSGGTGSHEGPHRPNHYEHEVWAQDHAPNAREGADAS